MGCACSCQYPREPPVFVDRQWDCSFNLTKQANSSSLSKLSLAGLSDVNSTYGIKKSRSIQHIRAMSPALANEETRRGQHGDAMAHPAASGAVLGVSLRWLVSDFLGEVNAYAAENNVVSSNVASLDVYNGIVSKQQRDTRYISRIEDGTHVVPRESTGRATVFVTHSWTSSFQALLSALSAEFLRECAATSDSSELPPDTFVWMDLFCMSPIQLDGVEAQSQMTDVKLAARTIDQHILFVDRNGDVLRNLWCLFEVWQPHQLYVHTVMHESLSPSLKGKDDPSPACRLKVLINNPETRLYSVAEMATHIEPATASTRNADTLHNIRATIFGSSTMAAFASTVRFAVWNSVERSAEAQLVTAQPHSTCTPFALYALGYVSYSKGLFYDAELRLREAASCVELALNVLQTRPAVSPKDTLQPDQSANAKRTSDLPTNSAPCTLANNASTNDALPRILRALAESTPLDAELCHRLPLTQEPCSEPNSPPSTDAHGPELEGSLDNSAALLIDLKHVKAGEPNASEAKEQGIPVGKPHDAGIFRRGAGKGSLGVLAKGEVEMDVFGPPHVTRQSCFALGPLTQLQALQLLQARIFFCLALSLLFKGAGTSDAQQREARAGRPFSIAGMSCVTLEQFVLVQKNNEVFLQEAITLLLQTSTSLLGLNMQHQLNPWLADMAEAQGQCHRLLGELHASREYHEQALIIRVKVLGKDNLQIAHSRYNLALVLSEMHEAAAAVANFQDAIAIYTATYGATHDTLAQAHTSLARCYLNSAKHTTAARHLSTARDVYLRLHGKNALQIATVLLELSNCAPRSSKTALANCSEALRIRAHGLHQHHPLVLEALNQVTCCLSCVGRDEEADRLNQQWDRLTNDADTLREELVREVDAHRLLPILKASAYV